MNSSKRFIYCPQCKNSTTSETDYEDENGKIDTQGRRCEECGWEGAVDELVRNTELDNVAKEQKMFEPLDPPELTPREQEDLASAMEYIERRIEDAVCTRMLDPEYRIDALSVLITDNESVQKTLDDFIMGYGDVIVQRGNLRCDVMAHLREQARRDAESGAL